MNKYKNVLFDLDGTLTDPGVGITNSVAYALNKYGISVSNRKDLFTFIGPPLHESFEVYYGFSKEEARTAVAYYREYYKDRGIFENVLYAGIPELVKYLHSSGYTLAVATSKPEVFAKQILEHFELSKYFAYIAGSNLDGTRTQKAEVIDYALTSCGMSDKPSAIMIGDRVHDILGAKIVGIDAVGVLFGYGSRAELENAHATYIVEHVEDIINVLEGWEEKLLALALTHAWPIKMVRSILITQMGVATLDFKPQGTLVLKGKEGEVSSLVIPL